MSSYFHLLGVHVSVTNLTLAQKTIFDWIKTKQKKYVCVAPVSTIVDCHRNSDYKFIINHASMVTPDGMPVVWAGRMRGHKTLERTYGPDLMRLICDKGQSEGISHFFYGGTEEVNLKLVEVLSQQYPDIQIAGMYAPPLLDVDAKDTRENIDLINKTNADIVWIGLGSPKQDYWMRNHRDQLDAPVLVGVGAAFDFIAGMKPQAPKWMQRSGLEWLFRLCSEPKRLWRRYLIGNSLFVWLFLKDTLVRLFKHHD